MAPLPPSAHAHLHCTAIYAFDARRHWNLLHFTPLRLYAAHFVPLRRTLVCIGSIFFPYTHYTQHFADLTRAFVLPLPPFSYTPYTAVASATVIPTLHGLLPPASTLPAWVLTRHPRSCWFGLVWFLSTAVTYTFAFFYIAFAATCPSSTQQRFTCSRTRYLPLLWLTIRHTLPVTASHSTIQLPRNCSPVVHVALSFAAHLPYGRPNRFAGCSARSRTRVGLSAHAYSTFRTLVAVSDHGWFMSWTFYP